MSKSTTSTRSNSVETPGENEVSVPSSPQNCIDTSIVPAIMENGDSLVTDCTIPTSPPPSYEHVLEETRLAAEQSNLHFAEPDTDEAKDDDAEENNDGGGGDPPNDTDDNCDSYNVDEDDDCTRAPQILHKSSKELYRAVAKQFGITCKMSDQCRCLDCQSHYFDCEYEYNEQEKTDGGLGAGTPMFISEVMHGTACNIL